MPTNSTPGTDRVGPDDEFPSPRFPAGVAIPPTVLFGVLTLAAVSLLWLRAPAVEQGGGPGPAGWPGLVPGIAVAVAAVWVFLTLRVLVVGPVRRLRRDVAATPGRRVRSIRRSAIWEVDRIAAALQAQRGGARSPGARTRRRVRLTTALAAVTVALIGWLGAAFAVASGGYTPATTILVTGGRHDAAAAAADLRHQLQEGLSGLQAIAGAAPATYVDDPRTLAAATLAARPIFRAVHVLNGDGAQVAAAGNARALRGPPPAAGITQLNSSGPEPIVVASAPIGGGYTAVAEYDIRALNAVLGRSGAQTRVLDADLRTVLSSDGYQAFTELTDPVLRTAANTALREGPTTTTQVVDGFPSTVSGYRVGFNDAAATLNWVVLQNQSLLAAGFVQDPTDRAVVVIIGASGGVALLGLGWIYIAAVRPLRRLGDHAEAIVRMLDGEPAPEPVAPQRIDEVGAIAAGLNRQLVVATRVPLQETQIRPRPAVPRPAVARPGSIPSSRPLGTPPVPPPGPPRSGRDPATAIPIQTRGGRHALAQAGPE